MPIPALSLPPYCTKGKYYQENSTLETYNLVSADKIFIIFILLSSSYLSLIKSYLGEAEIKGAKEDF